MTAPDGAVLLTAKEVAARFGVDAKSVVRWGVQGKLLLAGSPGAHCRFFAAEVEAIRRGEPREQARKLAEAVRDEIAAGGAPGHG